MKYCLSARSITLLGLLVSGTGLAQVSPQSKLFPITPCRVADTRIAPNGANAGPALVANAGRAFPIVGTCGIPATARAVVLNVTAVNATADGAFAIFPTGTAAPLGRDRAELPRREGARGLVRRTARDDRRHRRLGDPDDAAPCTWSWTRRATSRIRPARPATQLSAFANIATFGSSPQIVAHLRDVGIQGWINEQQAIPPMLYPSLPLQPNTIPNACTGTCQRDNYTMYPLQKQFFYNALYLPDQLRQRTAWALHKFLVISGQQEIQPSHMVPYLNTLLRNAFGSYRQLLIELTVSPAMGDYLNMRTSTLQNPNENYAREILQLFSIGLVQLNTNGTPILDRLGNTVPTYTQYDINELSRVFTGWRLDTAGQVPGRTTTSTRWPSSKRTTTGDPRRSSATGRIRRIRSTARRSSPRTRTATSTSSRRST